MLPRNSKNVDNLTFLCFVRQDRLKISQDVSAWSLVCRWNLNPVHGPYGYEEAERLYAPYDRLHHPDLPTRAELASVIAGITRRGQNAFVTISNHAEGCAPLTVRGVADEVAAVLAAAPPRSKRR